MSENNKDELTILKEKADKLGIKYSNNIGIDTLRERVKNAEANIEDTEEESTGNVALDHHLEEQKKIKQSAELMVQSHKEDIAEANVPKRPLTKQEKELHLRKFLIERDTRLVRIYLTLMNPNKREISGEIITVANRYLGEIKKFIPFDKRAYKNGYHVPYCIYRKLKNRKYISVDHNGEVTELPEFSISVLPSLTKEELEKLRIEQASRNND